MDGLAADGGRERDRGELDAVARGRQGHRVLEQVRRVGLATWWSAAWPSGNGLWASIIRHGREHEQPGRPAVEPGRAGRGEAPPRARARHPDGRRAARRGRRSLHRLATVLREQGCPAPAIPHAERALGPEHRWTVECRRSLEQIAELAHGRVR
jgi:hypothetical protein